MVTIRNPIPANITIPQSLSSVRFPLSALLLIASNLLPIYGVLAWNWSLFPVLVLFWVEALIVGAISALKMLFAYPTSFVMWIVKFFCFPFIGFFLIPYGMLVVILGMLVFGVFASDSVRHAAVSVLFSASSASGLLPLEEAMRVVRRELDAGVLLGITALAASHMFSFCWYYLVKGECNRVSLGELVLQPVARVWLMLMALNLGAFGVQRLDAPLWLLIPLIAVKIAIDLHAHLREHRKPSDLVVPGMRLPPTNGLQGNPPQATRA
jgi:hypothetical protein